MPAPETRRVLERTSNNLNAKASTLTEAFDIL
jgi:hypothetical protein